MTTAADISTKNTKNEILDAYHEALQEIKSLKKVGSKQEIKLEQDKQEVIKLASKKNAQEIVTELTHLKMGIVQSLEDLEQQLLREQKKLINLNQSIDFQTKELEELYEIRVNLDTLSALLQAQKQSKETFEKEMLVQRSTFNEDMLQKRSAWKREQDEVMTLWKEQETLQKKSRQREEEEYGYKRNLDRQKDQDQYNNQKQLLEKELVEKKTIFEKAFAEREANIILNEQELQKLKTQVEGFPKKLQDTIAETEKTITERLKFKHDYEVKLTQKEVEGEKKLHQQMIAALELKIAQQEKQIAALTDKANHAGLQVQEIAVKAIDGAARTRFYYPGQTEKLTDSTKG